MHSQVKVWNYVIQNTRTPEHQNTGIMLSSIYVLQWDGKWKHLRSSHPGLVRPDTANIWIPVNSSQIAIAIHPEITRVFFLCNINPPNQTTVSIQCEIIHRLAETNRRMGALHLC